MDELEKIVSLLESGKKSEAKKLLTEYLNNIKLSPAEQDRTFMEIASLFARVNNTLMRDYKELLEEVSEEFRDLNIKERILLPKRESDK